MTVKNVEIVKKDSSTHAYALRLSNAQYTFDIQISDMINLNDVFADQMNDALNNVLLVMNDGPQEME